MSDWALAWRLARRDMRGGLKGLRIFLVCLGIGVAAIAGTGQVSSAVKAGFTAEAARILGGDIEARFTHRGPTPEETAALTAKGGRVARLTETRGMAVFGEDRTLATVKAVDGAYPLYGEIGLDPVQPLAAALERRNGIPGAVIDPALAGRLGASIGDRLRIGSQEIEYRAALMKEPDAAVSGFEIAPRIIVAQETLDAAGLIQPGSLYNTMLRVALPPGVEAPAFRKDLEARFPESGWRLRDAATGAPGTARFMERLGSFLTLAGLAALAVGGVGVAAATRAWLDRKTDAIATLKTLGASAGLIGKVHLIQIMIMAGLAAVIGGMIGAGTPLALGGMLAESLPVPARIGFYPGPLALAMLYGLLTALLFALIPLGRAAATRPAQLYRALVAGGEAPRPRAGWIGAALIVAALLIGAATFFSATPMIAAGFLGGLAVVFGLLRGMAWGISRLARRLARKQTVTGGRPALRLALAAAGGPGGETSGTMLSLGIGLTLLAAIGLIDANLRHVLQGELPKQAPSLFFIDIPAADGARFKTEAAALPGVTRVETAPMLRGRLIALNDVKLTRENTPEKARWLIQGDRGLTYSDEPPPGSDITQGAWWSPDYAGPPVVSFAAEEGKNLGLKLGDKVTVNVLGRNMTATVTNFREVNWRTFGVNFVMIFNSGALKSAPHAHLASVYSDDPAKDGALLRALSQSHPNAAAIRVREAMDQATSIIERVLGALRAAAGATLLAGLAVLVGAAATGQGQRLRDAAILKSLGATRGMLTRAFALRFLIVGAAAGTAALGFATVAAWAAMRFVLEEKFVWSPGAALAVIGGGALLTLAVGAAFIWRAMAARPAEALRARE